MFPSVSRLHWLWFSVVALALPYIAALTYQIIKAYGGTREGLIAAAETINADTRDMAIWSLAKVGVHLGGESERPMQYLVFCQPQRLTMPGEVESIEHARKVVKAELRHTAGDAYVKIIQAIDAGNEQIAIDFWPGGFASYSVRSSPYFSELGCSPASASNELKEWERIPARVIFNPEATIPE